MVTRKPGGEFGRDFLASIVVFLVALPLCMGIAIASGVPPAAGLITGIVGGIVVGALGGAPLQVSGPAAGLTVLIYQLIQEHGIAALGPVVVFAGIFQVAAGLLRLGQWFRAISPAVIFGMLSGIGVLIFTSQFHVMVDDKPRSSGLNNLASIPESILKGIFPVDGSSHHIAAALGLLTIAVMLVWSKFRPQALHHVPAPLLAVGVAASAAALLRMPVQYVNVPENLFATIDWTNWATLAGAFNPKLLGEAAALAFIASAETLLSTAAIDQMHRGQRANYDRELAAQGVGNLLCGIAGALPMTGVIVRSSANVEAGASTRRSAILHGVWILALIGLAPGLLRMIPTAALAAILVYTGYKLINIAKMKQLAARGKGELLVYGVTFGGIIATDLLTGVLLGLGTAIAKLIYTFSHLEIRSEERLGGRRMDVYLVGSATFLRIPKMAAFLEKVRPGMEVHIHLDELTYVDHACMEFIQQWRSQHEGQGNYVVIEWAELERRYDRLVTAA